MIPILKIILAIFVGLFIGGAVNMFFINISHSIIPFPEGFDNTTVEGLKAGMHLMTPKHFLFPFIAHAMGTLVGALIAAFFSYKKLLAALIVGASFFIGGVMMVMKVPSPLWFTLVDLIGAYFPMSLLAYFIISKIQHKS